MANISLGADTPERFEECFRNAVSHFSGDNDFRNRLQCIDRYVQRESARNKEDIGGSFVNKYLGDKTKLRNFEVPTIFIKLDTAKAYLTSTFLTGFPIFSAVGTKTKAPVAAALHALMGRDQVQFSWVENLMKVHNDALKYNFCAVEVDWCQKFYTQSAAVTDSRNQPESSQKIEYEGNSITRIDPYNIFWDRSCYPAKVAMEGTHVGYNELLNYVAVKGRISALNNSHKIMSNLRKAFQSESKAAGAIGNYYEPCIRNKTEAAQGKDWAGYFGFDSSVSMSNASGTYVYSTMYVRLIPKEYKIIAPRSGSPDVWKLIFINGIVIYAQRLETDCFPLIIAQANDEGMGLETKSFCENLEDVQDISSVLQNARIASLRRAIADRAIYDPRKIRPTDINSSNPESKIPVKLSTDETLQSAYYQIPYNDNIGASFNNEFGLVQQFADDISGLNRASQGNFIKGNKTLNEFESIMRNAQARSEQAAIMLGNQLYAPIKAKLKANYVKFAIKETLLDQTEQEMVEVDPAKLSEAASQLTLSDGLTPSSKIMNAETLQMAMQGLSTIPELNAQYDVAGLFVYMLQNLGLDGLNDFKRQQPAPTQPGGTPAQPAPANAGVPGSQQPPVGV